MKLREVRMTPAWALIAFSWLLAAGCAKEEGGATVNGKITYQDAAVPVGSISFIQPGAPTATSQIQPDGSYTLLNPKKTERIPVGGYDVVIIAIDDPLARHGDESKGSKMTILVPQSVIRLATTPLHFEVVEGENTIDIDLDKLPSESKAGAK